MSELKLYGMKAAYDELIATAVKRQHEPQRVVGDLLAAEISEKQARSIKYQITIAKLPLARDIDDFVFDDTPVNETLVRDLAGGAFLTQQRNVVLVGGTGTGKTHLAVAIARSCIRAGSRGRFFNVVDLVNRLEAETRAGRQGRRTWIMGLWFILQSDKGISSIRLAEALGVSQPTAWRMVHVLRLLVLRDHSLGGTVEIDEFHFGAKPRRDPNPPKLGRGRKGHPRTTKTPALAIVQRPSGREPGTPAGEARAAVVADLSLDERRAGAGSCCRSRRALDERRMKGIRRYRQRIRCARYGPPFPARVCARQRACQFGRGLQRSCPAHHRRRLPSHHPPTTPTCTLARSASAGPSARWQVRPNAAPARGGW
ncbi:hypothetical protein FHS63_005261 [Azospirillum doebereinerae]